MGSQAIPTPARLGSGPVDYVRRVFRRRERDPFAPMPADGYPPAPTGFRARAASVLRPELVTHYVGVAGERIRQSPVFAPFSRLTVGLTYEGASLKLVVSDQRRVISWETIPFDPRLLSGNLVVEPFNLGRLIRDAFAMRGLPRYRVHCALPAAGALSRVIEI